MKTLSIGYSTCPNDTFIFDAMIHHKVDTEGLSFEPLLEDVERLNHRAFRQELDITKVSYHAFLYLEERYHLLNSGSALGHNCGPLLICKHTVDPHQLSPDQIGIPGRFTTAHLLLQLFLGKNLNAREYSFSEIEAALLRDEIKAGVIIHENRFTYQDKGLKKIQDLGEFWESHTQMPVPLGGILIRKSLDHSLRDKVDRVLRRSVQFAFDNPQSSLAYVRQHAQEMSEEVMRKHIELYVNAYTLELGEEGRKAVERLKEEAHKLL